jgi:hypothetical protein
VTGEEGLETGEAEHLNPDPPVAEVAVQLAGSKRKAKKKKAKRTWDNDDAVLAAAMQQAKLEKDMLREETNSEQQRQAEAMTNAQKDNHRNVSCPIADTSEEEIFYSPSKETRETSDDQIEQEGTRDPVRKCTRLSSAVRQFIAGSCDEASLVQGWNAVETNQVEQDTVLRQLVRRGFEENNSGPLVSRIVIALLTLLKNDATSWPIMEYELKGCFCRSKERSDHLGNFYRIPEFYICFISELLATNLDFVKSFKGVLEPLISLGDPELGGEGLTRILLKVKASRAMPGFRLAIRRMESARVELEAARRTQILISTCCRRMSDGPSVSGT